MVGGGEGTPCEDEGRDGSDGATGRGLPGDTGSWEEAREAPPLAPSEEAQSCTRLDLRLLASGTWRELSSVI